MGRHGGRPSHDKRTSEKMPGLGREMDQTQVHCASRVAAGTCEREAPNAFGAGGGQASARFSSVTSGRQAARSRLPAGRE